MSDTAQLFSDYMPIVYAVAALLVGGLAAVLPVVQKFMELKKIISNYKNGIEQSSIANQEFISVAISKIEAMSSDMANREQITQDQLEKANQYIDLLREFETKINAINEKLNYMAFNSSEMIANGTAEKVNEIDGQA